MHSSFVLTVTRHISGYRGLAADCSPPSSAEIKNEWSCNSSPLIHLRGVSRDETALPSVPVTCSDLLCGGRGSLMKQWEGVDWIDVADHRDK